MAVGITTIKTVGRLVFDLSRGEDVTTRTVDIAYPKTDTESEELQTLVNTTKTKYTSANYNILIQPANWRDTKISEDAWTTTNVRYEVVVTSVTPVTPEEPVTLGSAQEHQEEHQEYQEQQGQ